MTDHQNPVTLYNPDTGETFETRAVTTEPGGHLSDITDPSNRRLLDCIVEDGTLIRSKGRDDELLNILERGAQRIRDAVERAGDE